MTDSIEWRIPPSVLHHLERIPTDVPVVLLLRHSVRGHLPAGDAGHVLPITEIGRKLARQFGEKVGGRLRSLHASPLVRCVQTAEAIQQGAGTRHGIIEDRLLGDPGIYVVDGRRAWPNWEQRGHEGVMQHLVSASHALPGMARPDEAARFLVQHMLAAAGDGPGVHVFVTHDSLVTATAARFLGQPLATDDWPWYLEGAFFWRTTDALHTVYRDNEARRAPVPLCSLSESDVIEFARREIAATVGLDSGVRFFLAGGAFKTLISGRPPRDLDLWAPSPQDREALLEVLRARGAKERAKGRYNQAFEIAGRVVEIPDKVEPPTLDERLGYFDIGLSAVGVEHRADGTWSARIHPLAIESVCRREVLLLKPLVNWKHCLMTLERMRRYAEELGYAIPPEEEAEVWRVFAAQSAETRVGMKERFAGSTSGGFGVGEELACRFP